MADETEYDESREPVSLAEAAAAGLSGEDGVQGAFEEADFLKIKFVGMSYDSLNKEMKIGDEATFVVRARCVGIGEEAMKDGHVRHYAKMDVQSVIVNDPQA